MASDGSEETPNGVPMTAESDSGGILSAIVAVVVLIVFLLLGQSGNAR